MVGSDGRVWLNTQYCGIEDTPIQKACQINNKFTFIPQLHDRRQIQRQKIGDRIRVGMADRFNGVQILNILRCMTLQHKRCRKLIIDGLI